MQKLLPLASLVLLLTSCVSAGIHAPSEGEPLRVMLSTGGGRQQFTLVNAEHTDPVSLYSTSQPLGTFKKVTSDSMMVDLIDYIGSHGFGEHEQMGSIAKAGLANYSVAFEIESPAGISHWGVTKRSDLEELKAIAECNAYFFNEAYNQVEAFQTIKNKDGTFQFKEN